MRRNIRKFIILILILCISIGFAVITASLIMNASFSFTNSSFDLHFSNINVLSTSTVTSPTATITDSTTINYSGTFNKPGDYIDFSFYIVNGGTIDGQISQINTNLTSEQANYITYSLKYEIENTNVSVNDYIYAGQSRKVIAHFEYKEDIDDFIDLSNLNLNLTMNFIQPQTVTTTVWNYEYSGTEQYFIVPKTGTYKIELWGASGGAVFEEDIGKGAYTSGKIKLNKNQKIYLYVGGAGKYAFSDDSSQNLRVNNDFNSGSSATTQLHPEPRYWGIGGGATDIRLVNGNWNNFNSLKSRIMVAGAGGGGYEQISAATYKRYGGAAGGLTGYQGNQMNYYYGSGGTGGTQTRGGYSECLEELNCISTLGINAQGTFGIAGTRDNFNGHTGGGSGYYGGGGSTHVQGAGGGSSYISGHIGCVAIEGSSTQDNITFPTKNSVACDDGTIDIECSKHYLGYVFTSTKMIDGNGYEWKYHDGDTEVTASTSVVGMPTHSGTGTMTGNTGNGYAKITYVG